ncbi:MAG: histidine kinase, partial [Flavisolibacter sp.]|nr:histidine kinase [Flavisolibacter sp.]
LMYTFLLSREHYIVHRFKVTMAGILFWIFIFSASLAAIILQENRKKEWNHRIGIAERYSSYNEANILNIINTEIAYLDSDFLVNNFWRFADKRENLFLRDSIIDGNTPAYVKNFNTKLFVYDSLNIPVNNLAPMSFAEWNNIYSLHSKPTGFRDIHYHESAFDKYTFITKRAIADSGNLMGTLFFISMPRKYNEGEIKPDLFKHNGIVDAVNETTYRIAVYENGKLTGFSSKYPFPISVAPNTIPIGVSKRINGDFNELWYKASTQKIVVIASKRETLIESITLFSYLFCAFLLMVAIVQLFAFFMKLSGNIKIRNVFWQLNIRSQVHGTIILVSALSFIIIGIATITFFIKRYNQNNEDKLNRTALIMVEQMREALTRRDTFDDIVAVHNSGSNNDLQQTINEVADIHNVDVNVYDPTGNLKITSQSEVYNKGVLSQKMHPIAFYKLRLQKLVQFVQKENLSSLQYLSMYYAVRDNKGDVRAYINVPYFLSQYELTQEISNFLVTIINLNAFIFLIAGIVALIIANKITRSFSVIGDKMKEIRLGKSNEEIEWTRNDEIGALVVQYNKMVQELERSADALAKSEREGAWREMARQVAHEIKNPLTPMKLSIQYLQKAVDNNQPNVKELTANVATTLVEQIDHLSKIAADFSRFANIGNRNIEQFDLHQTIDGLKDLYSTYPNVTVIWNKAEEPVPIEADRTHINRLFANLLANAVEACHKNKQCIIEIYETLQEDAVLIEVKDNGDGIPAEMQPKIFTPNFTTKSSGTG